MDYPTFAFCLPVLQWKERTIVANKVMKIVDYFCAASIPHNMFWTFGTHAGQSALKIFVFPRSQAADKNKITFNVGFCELSGYAPVGGGFSSHLC